MDVVGFQQTYDRLAANIERYVLGKHHVVEAALICLLSRGHLLIEDNPGLGKTLLASCLARSIEGASVHRIQFTPDLLPTDVIGTNVYLQNTGTFKFRHGPVFANIIVADEINRASPRTQSALLEVMEEGQVTFDGKTRSVPQPFVVVATQNPVDTEGTYPLPEAQLDRFLMRIRIGYPDTSAERQLLDDDRRTIDASRLAPVVDIDTVQEMVATPARVRVDADMRNYLVKIVADTRELATPSRNGTSPPLLLGASPRGSLALMRAARARAASLGRDYVIPEDIKALAIPVLAHRLVLRGGGGFTGTALRSEQIVQEILDRIPVPA